MIDKSDDITKTDKQINEERKARRALKKTQNQLKKQGKKPQPPMTVDELSNIMHTELKKLQRQINKLDGAYDNLDEGVQDLSNRVNINANAINSHGDILGNIVLAMDLEDTDDLDPIIDNVEQNSEDDDN